MKKHKHKLITISILITLTSLAIALINKFINASATLKTYYILIKSNIMTGVLVKSFTQRRVPENLSY